MSSPRICEAGGGGTFFPVLESEHSWPPALRAILYAAAMIYLFLGVNLVADKFVSAIDVITSKQRRFYDKASGRVITKMVWNSTIANLTLLALGSSAPEILLSIMECIGRGFRSGDLGPSTIVGSAAFNLFVIIAVCIVTIPSPETRQIKQQAVFVVTAIFSLLAYIWLVFIIEVSTPNVIDIWEAVATLLFLPVLIVVSYAADVGLWPFRRRVRTLNYDCLADDVEQQSLGVARGSEQGAAAASEGAAPNSGADVEVPGCVAEDWAEPSSVAATAARASIGGAGVLAFDDDMWEVMVGCDNREVTIPVFRQRGTEGLVVVKCRTEGGSAIAGRDFVEQEVELEFAPGATQANVVVELLPKRVGEESRQFGIVLDDVRGGAVLKPASSEEYRTGVLTVTILNENEMDGRGRGSILTILSLPDPSCFGGSLREWYDEVVDSVCSVAEGDETPTMLDWFFHIVGLPWKLTFAVLVPPSTWMGGWLCFVLSLLCIGGVTMLVIDFAELFGCVTDVGPQITAITFVALGTSMPDLFASVSAARADEWADASIVNVTGSNSVNVFVGIGVPWTMSAVYWSFKPEGQFVVHGDDLAFSVVVFTVAALMAIALIYLRRKKFGGELGGPFGPKVLSALLMILLWIYYIALSVWKIVSETHAFWMQVAAIFLGAIILEHIMLAAGLGLWLCSGPAPQRRNVAPLPDERPQLQGVRVPEATKHSPAPIVCGVVTHTPEGTDVPPEEPTNLSESLPPLPMGPPPPLATEVLLDGATAAVPTVPSAEVLLANAVSFGAAALVVVAAKRLQRRVRRRSEAGMEENAPNKPPQPQERRPPRSALFHTRKWMSGDHVPGAAVPLSLVQLIAGRLSEWAGAAHKADCEALSYKGLMAAAAHNATSSATLC